MRRFNFQDISPQEMRDFTERTIKAYENKLLDEISEKLFGPKTEETTFPNMKKLKDFDTFLSIPKA